MAVGHEKEPTEGQANLAIEGFDTIQQHMD